MRFWIPWILACHDAEPSVGNEVGGTCAEESFVVNKGSDEGFCGNGYVARMAPIRIICGSKSTSRG